ncbi:MAG: TolC family protein [Gammaproteobacteria bacterium]|nr:TolC family protein [Gammaproteobacteria bacterium]
MTEANRSAPQLQARLAAADSANAEAVAAGRLPAPEIIAGVENLPVNGPDAWSVDRDFMTMRKVGVMQSFGNAHRRSAERSMAQARAVAALTEAAQTRLDVSLSTAQAWIAVLTTEQAVQALAALQPNYELQVTLARNALANGRAASAELLEAQSSAAELADRLLVAHQQALAARAGLARWIGTLAARPLAPPPSFEVLPASASSLQAGVHRHAELRAFDARVAEAKAAIAVATADRRPDWSSEVSYGQRGPGYSNMVSVEVRVSLPLFAASRADPVIAARRATVRQLEADRQAAFRMHTAELAATLADWQAGRDRVALYEQQRLPLARARSAAALAGLAAGTTDASTALSVLRDQLNLELSFAEIYGSYGRAWAYLNFLSTGSNAP